MQRTPDLGIGGPRRHLDGLIGSDDAGEPETHEPGAGPWRVVRRPMDQPGVGDQQHGQVHRRGIRTHPLRKRRINKVLLGGMLANMCVESHLRDLLEQGFEVYVVRDAIAGPRHPEWGDGYQAALVNYAFLAHGLLWTADVIAAMRAAISPINDRRLQ